MYNYCKKIIYFIVIYNNIVLLKKINEIFLKETNNLLNNIKNIEYSQNLKNSMMFFKNPKKVILIAALIISSFGYALDSAEKKETIFRQILMDK